MERTGSALAEWYDGTWNPTGGCSPVSPGCDHCEALQTVSKLARIGGKGGARYAGLTAMGRSGLQWTGEIRLRADVLVWPLLQRTPRRILIDSLADLFHEKLAVETVDVLHAVIAIAHWHRFLVLTKRADRMRAYYADPRTPYRIAVAIDSLAATVLPSQEPHPRPDGEGTVPAPGGSPHAECRCAAALGGRAVPGHPSARGLAEQQAEPDRARPLAIAQSVAGRLG
jgi:hypothetical protein